MEFSSGLDRAQTEFKLHYFDYQELGISNVALSEGQILELEVKSPNGDVDNFDYLYNMEPLPEIEGQEQDFELLRSNFNQNCTSPHDGFCPGLLYVPI